MREDVFIEGGVSLGWGSEVGMVVKVGLWWIGVYGGSCDVRFAAFFFHTDIVRLHIYDVRDIYENGGFYFLKESNAI